MKALAAVPLAILTIVPARAAPSPLDVVLMIDVSSSVTHPGIFKVDRTLVPEATAALASALDPADRVRLGTFGTAIAITPTPLTGRSALAQAGSTLADAIGGPSPLWDALDAAASALEGADGRRGIIVITDGRSTGNRRGFADVAARLEQARLPVFVVALDVKRPPTPDPSVRLRQLADRSGGTYILVKREDLESGVTQAVRILHGS